MNARRMNARKESCSKIVRKMYLMLEEGESSFCDTLRAHLEACEQCSEKYRGLKDLVGLCQRFPGVEIPEEQRQRMKARLLDLLGGGNR
jgi:hypothetical protein